jgi:hypothetical protein
MELSRAQMDQVIAGLNMVMRAVGALTVDELVEKQRGLLESVPPDQHELFMTTLRDQVVTQFGASVKSASDEFEKALDDALLKQAH